MIKENKFGLPFKSVIQYPINYNKIYIKTSVGIVTLVNSLENIRKCNSSDIRENIENMYSWGLQTNLEYDLYSNSYGALIGLIDSKYNSIEEVILSDERLMCLVQEGYEFVIGPGYDINPETGTILRRKIQNQESKQRALYCSNYKDFLEENKVKAM